MESIFFPKQAALPDEQGDQIWRIHAHWVTLGWSLKTN
jgi:hypothetical protein